MGRLLAVGAVSLLGVAAAAAAAAADGDGERLALLPLKSTVRDPQAAAAVEAALERELARLGEFTPPRDCRELLRRFRLRDADAAPAASLRRIAKELGVDRLAVATLHDVATHPAPDLALSLRLYEGGSGDLVWAGFMGRSGLDGRKLLGLGVLESVDSLAPELVRRLVAQLPLAAPRRDPLSPSREAAAARDLGTLALVPFTAYVPEDALAVAEAATEAARAVMQRVEVEVASPGCVRESLRRQRAAVWGELAESARRGIADSCGADRILTGSVELWEKRGSGLEPEPEIGVALRLLDTATGRILWMGAREAGGWDNATLFKVGRVYSRGALLDRLLSKLTLGLLRQQASGPRERAG